MDSNHRSLAKSRGSRQVNILQILAGRLSGYPTVGRCGDVRFPPAPDHAIAPRSGPPPGRPFTRHCDSVVSELYLALSQESNDGRLIFRERFEAIVIGCFKNRSLTITADVTISDGGAEGTIIAQGGRFGGWSLYLKDQKPVYTYNFLGMQRFTIAGTQPVAAGRATIRYDFACDGGRPGAGGTGGLFVNGAQVAQCRIERTQCCAFSADEGADVGLKEGTPVSEDYQVPFKFTGRIERVTIEVKNPSPAEQQADDKADAAAKLEKDLSD
jgi:hypothetical protein